MRKFVKRTFLTLLLVGICAFVFTTSYVFVVYVTSPVKFDKNKITDNNLSINLYDNKNGPIAHTNINKNFEFIEFELIPKHTKECFISIEDKDFYKHSGINIKRIVSAGIKNVLSMKFKEGASTISQQLIKNTHLTNEKTIKRKINEIKLTKALEKSMSKNEILENYLNIIYFGDNCYGIQNASKHYFSKSATKLTLDESALLAGIIKSPNKYHPINNYDNAIKRRNLVLNEMKRDGNISNIEYQNAINTKTKIDCNPFNNESLSYIKASVLEAENILKMPEKQIAIGEYRIFTYLNTNKQNALESSIESIKEDCSMISMNSKTGHVEAYAEKSTLPLINVKRQPASAIKPILVYAPAINENIISPSTHILDEDISINGYSPKNLGNKYYGHISCTEALSKSLNVPAVKILSYVGINKAKSYLERQNIEFDNNDNNLALALGGMTQGMTLKELVNCYQTLANNGNFIHSKFISHIVDKNGKVVYKNDETQKNIYREDTAYLITDMLNKTTKTGTAKLMSNLPYFVASKTGTSSISKNNIDAYNISYTSEDVVGCWVGNLDNSSTDVVGGGTPTRFVKNYFNEIYNQHKPINFNIPSSVVELDIDAISLKNEHTIYLANNYLPDRYRIKGLFSRFNLPKTQNLNTITINPPNITGNVQNGVAEISFNSSEYYYYELYELIDNKEVFIEEASGKNGKSNFNIPLSPNIITKFGVKVKVKNFNNGTEIVSDMSNIISLYYRN